MSLKASEIRNEIKKLERKLQVEKTNLKFQLSTKPQKRVLIAKDVILQIGLNKFVPQTGCYVKSQDILEALPTNGTTVELKPLLAEVTTCSCCAKGAIFLSEVMNRNQFSASRRDFEGLGSETITDRLDGLFTQNQLDLIETAFERDVIESDNEYLQDGHNDDWSEKFTSIAKKAIAFGKRYSSNDKRLIAIMKNIVANKGTFKP